MRFRSLTGTGAPESYPVESIRAVICRFLPVAGRRERVGEGQVNSDKEGIAMRPPTADLSVESTLRHCELLEPLDDAQITALAELATVRQVREGEALFKQNDQARDLFIVESGRVAVRLTSPSGHVIEMFEAGQYRLVGWSAFVAPHAYVADGWALEDSAVLVISGAAAEKVLLARPDAAYEVMKLIAAQISTRLRDLKEELIELLSAGETT